MLSCSGIVVEFFLPSLSFYKRILLGRSFSHLGQGHMKYMVGVSTRL